MPKKNVAHVVAKRLPEIPILTSVTLTFPDRVDDPTMPVLEYLIRDFVAKGGVVWDMEGRIKVWKTMRFVIGTPLASAWKGDAETTYGALPEQPTVADFLGTTLTWTVDTSQDVATHANTSFNDLMKEGVDVIDPIGFLALFHGLPDPADISAYPARETWEFLAGLVKTDDGVFAASGSSYSVGLHARWDDPESSNSYSRARPVVRSHA